MYNQSREEEVVAGVEPETPQQNRQPWQLPRAPSWKGPQDRADIGPYQ